MEYTYFDDIYYGNINKITENNQYFRRVLSTTPNMQLVVMSLKPKQEIGMEIHPYTTQFIRIEKGNGIALIDNVKYELYDGIAIIVPLNTKHNIINISNKPLKLYTIYTPPIHAADEVL